MVGPNRSQIKCISNDIDRIRASYNNESCRDDSWSKPFPNQIWAVMNFKKWAKLGVQKCIWFGNGLDQPWSLQDSFIIMALVLCSAWTTKDFKNRIHMELQLCLLARLLHMQRNVRWLANLWQNVYLTPENMSSTRHSVKMVFWTLLFDRNNLLPKIAHSNTNANLCMNFDYKFLLNWS